MKVVVGFALVFAMVTLVVPAAAEGPGCLEIMRNIEGKTYVAKEPLYDTVVGYEGIIDLERDKEEIPVGATCRVKHVDCGGSKVEVTLKQVVGAKEIHKVEIKFRISKHQRNAPEGMDDFWKMFALVLEEPQTEERSEEK